MIIEVNFQAVFLIIVSYTLIWAFNRNLGSKNLLSLVLVLTFHHIIAYLYAFKLDIPGNEHDPDFFIGEALKCLEGGNCRQVYIGYQLYVHYLASALNLFGSLYAVYIFNVILFSFTMFFILKISNLIGTNKYNNFIILVIGFWPSITYFTTLPYREVFELLFLVIAMYSGLKGRAENNLIYLGVSMISLLIMGLFHVKGLLYIAPIIFILIVFYRSEKGALHLLVKVSMVLFLIVSVVMIQSGYFGTNHYVTKKSYGMHSQPQINNYNVTNKKKEGLNENRGDDQAVEEKSYIEESLDYFVGKIINYRSTLDDANVRTQFPTKINGDSYMALITSSIKIYVDYMFSPYFGQVKTMPDVIAYLESHVRLILFLLMMIALYKGTSIRVLVYTYLGLTIMWSVGVISYGAAIRHHVLTNWILVIVSMYVIAELNKHYKRLDKN
jgi:hypothetical protein